MISYFDNFNFNTLITFKRCSPLNREYCKNIHVILLSFHLYFFKERNKYMKFRFDLIDYRNSNLYYEQCKMLKYYFNKLQ